MKYEVLLIAVAVLQMVVGWFLRGLHERRSEFTKARREFEAFDAAVKRRMQELAR